MELNNIISNNCTGGFIYSDLNHIYLNPFIWSTITSYNFNKLIDEYDTLNFEDIEIEPSLLTKSMNTDRWINTFSILIDNRKICINYIHHHVDKERKNLFKDGVDLYHKDMKIYVKDLYNRRIKRMIENHKDPVFILCKTIFYSDDEFYALIYKPTKYKKIVCLPFEYSIDTEKIPINTFIVNLPKDCYPEPKYAKFLIENHLDLLVSK